MVLGINFPPIDHLVRWPALAFDDTPFAFNKTTMVYVLAVVLTLTFFFVAGRRAQLVPVGTQNVAEASVDFIRDSVIMQTMGPAGMAYLPFLITLFFFIFFVNIFEIVPFIQFPGNARMAVPLLLALTVYVVYHAVGVRTQGLRGYLRNSLIPTGVPKAMLFIVVPLEAVSLFFTRPFSLAVRLFANMLAGHFILVTFALLAHDLFEKTYVGWVLPFPLLVAVTGFEVLVSLLQAYIFTILTAVYIGGSMSPDH